MGKTKVHELAKELGITNNEVIEFLKKNGFEVKSHLSVIEDKYVDKVRSNFSKMSNKKSDTKKNVEEQSKVHIIRRNVKVIKTDSEKDEIEEISTSISGDIKKSHKIVDNSQKHTSTQNDNRSNKKNSRNKPYNKFANNRNINVIITRNGKPVEKHVEDTKVEKTNKYEDVNEKKDVSTNKKEEIIESRVEKEEISVMKDIEKSELKQTNQFNRNSNKNFKNNKKDYQERNNDRKNDDRNDGNRQNSKDRHSYNNRNRNFESRNNSELNNNSDNRKFDKNRNRIPKTGYNKNTSNDRVNNVGNNNRYNNSARFNNNSGYRKNNTDNTNYQVNKFIKKEASTAPEQKEVREYSNNNIDKRKYNNDKGGENKKDKLDKNKLRERQSRVSTTKLRGLEVDSSSGLLDLYERDSDTSRKTSAKKKGSKPKKQNRTMNQTKIIPMSEVKLPEIITVKEFAESIKKQASEVIKKLFALGIMATVNQEIDFDTAFLVAGEFGITAEKKIEVTEEDILFDESEDKEEDLMPRPPIVVVMGHVDHGKTSLLDKIRKADVVAGEAGGITQHIGAYKVKCKDREICFLDTPGHEAFTAMRARGAQVTDIAIIVVAADDGIKPQTIEAIDHAKAAGVSIIVAINKIDKPTANVDKVKQELLEVGLVAEEWGGDTICVPISAMTGEGIDNLLEMILLVADMKELKANPKKQSKGTILEARLDKNIGTVVSMLVQRGELNVGDTIVVGDIIGKVRAMKDDRGKKVKFAGPSTPVEIIGLSEVPHTGDVFYEVENEKVAKQLVAKRRAEHRIDLIKKGSKVTLDDLFGQIKQGKIKDLNIIIKADVQGSVEAMKESLEKLSNDEVRVRILHASTGGIKESDVTLASVSNAIIIGFNVRPEAEAAKQAEKEKVDLRLYRVIYDAIEDVEVALKGMAPKKYKEIMYGTCEVRKVFKITGVGIVAGCYVKSGKIVRGATVRLVRDSIVIFEIKIDSLKREKDDVKEVNEGYECGIRLEKFNDIKEGDIFECFEMIEDKGE